MQHAWTEDKCVRRVVDGNLKIKDQLEYLGVDGRIILKLILNV